MDDREICIDFEKLRIHDRKELEKFAKEFHIKVEKISGTKSGDNYTEDIRFCGTKENFENMADMATHTGNIFDAFANIISNKLGTTFSGSSPIRTRIK